MSERQERRAALGRLLAKWEAELGPVDPEVAEAARRAFDELDGVSPTGGAEAGAPSTRHEPC